MASVVTIVYLVGAAVRENYLAQWRTVQQEYRNILREKATDDRGRELLAKFRVEMKQASIPALGMVDRCVTCHNGVDDPRMTDSRSRTAPIPVISSTSIPWIASAAQCAITARARP